MDLKEIRKEPYEHLGLSMNPGEHLTARAFTAFWGNRLSYKSESEGDLPKGVYSTLRNV